MNCKYFISSMKPEYSTNGMRLFFGTWSVYVKVFAI